MQNIIPAYAAVVAVVRIDFLFNEKFAFATEVSRKRKIGTRHTVLGKLQGKLIPLVHLHLQL